MATDMLRSVRFREAVKDAARMGLRLEYDPAIKLFDLYDAQTNEWLPPALDSLRNVQAFLSAVAFAERRVKAVLDKAMAQVGWVR